jgi:hypothetical protein
VRADDRPGDQRGRKLQPDEFEQPLSADPVQVTSALGGS